MISYGKYRRERTSFTKDHRLHQALKRSGVVIPFLFLLLPGLGGLRTHIGVRSPDYLWTQEYRNIQKCLSRQAGLIRATYRFFDRG